MKIVYMGTPEFSVKVLESLLERYQVEAVVSQPDKLVGRKKILTETPVKKSALKHSIKVIQPKNIKKEYKEITSLKPDLIVTCAYGQILPKEILDCPKYGCINVHASLLPKLRGGAPIQRAIMEGYYETGITIMYMNEGMDDGDIIKQNSTSITDNDNLESLSKRLSKIGSKLLLEVITDIQNNKVKRTKQDETMVTYAYNITKDEEHLDFSKTSREIFNHIRALNPIPGAYAILNNKRIKIYDSIITDRFYTTKSDGEIVKCYQEGIGVSTKDGEIILTLLQPEGKNKISGASFVNGNKEIVGNIFK